MEDDDEFGDLYTDVLQPLTTSFQPPSQPPPVAPATSHQTEIPKASTATLRSRPIDLNLNSSDDDDEDNFFGAANSNSDQRNQTLASLQPGFDSLPAPTRFDLNKESSQGAENSEGLGGVESDLQARVSEKKGGDSKLPLKGYAGTDFADEADIDVVVEERDSKDDDFVNKDGNVQNCVSESGNVENLGVGVGGSGTREMDPIIPGVSIPGVSGGVEGRGNATFGDDWDSDSEDDLQIVLNDNNHGPMGIDRMGGVMVGEDEDGEHLVIVVADNDDRNHQPMMTEEVEWGGEEAGANGDGERKEAGEGAKVSGVGGVAVAPKIGFSNHVYHPYHSQFKYVRPGATPIPGAASTPPGGTPGQVCPTSSVVPVVGRGRGDWRPIGIKGGPPAMQKGFHPGYGVPVWGTGASGRGYGSGLEFTLPSHKTIFEVDIDNFEEKPWRIPGIDITDFFNFGLNEESWKDYCKKLEQLRLETTMQSKIHVYESGRAEQGYDPDLPPELAAAAGIQDIPSDSSKAGKIGTGLSDLAKGPARVRPLPTGGAIQVETGYGERLPSSDTRKPRISDLDAIIEIVCQDSADDGSQPGNNLAEQEDIDPPSLDVREGDEFDNENSDHVPNACNSQKKEKEGIGRSASSDAFHDNTTEDDSRLPLSSEAPPQYHPDSREQTPVYTGKNHATPPGERKKVTAQGRVRDTSPSMTKNESTGEKHFSDNQTEESTENSDGKHSPTTRSPVGVEEAAELSFDLKDATNDEISLDKQEFDMDNEGLALNASQKDDMHDDVTTKPASKKQKLTSQVEEVMLHEVDDGEDSRTGRSSENSKARSGISKDYRRLRNSVEEEEVHGGRSTHMDDYKRSVGGDEGTNRRKVRGERPEHERHRIHAKGKEDSYPHKVRDPYPGSHSLAKYEACERRKESDNVEGLRQRRDENLQGRRPRAEDTRKKELRDETGSKQQTKIREVERSEKDEHYQPRKQLDNGSWRASYDKDIGSRQGDRDDSLKGRNESIDELHSKRRKEEAYLRREYAAKEEMLHAHRENSSGRKRERDYLFDQRRRDELARLRDDDQSNVRVKEGVLFQRDRGERQRDRDEWHRLKHSSEEIISKKDKEARAGIKNDRPTEGKTWASHSRGKDEYQSSDKEYHQNDAGRNEVIKRRERVENDSLSHHRACEDVYSRGNQLNNDERRVKHDRASTRNDRISIASDNYKVPERKHKENPRRSKESEVVDRNSLVVSKKSRDESGRHKSDMVSSKGRVEQGGGDNNIHLKNPPRKNKEEASSDGEQPESRRGRSKLERWTSHKEQDFSIGVKPSSSIKIRQIDIVNGTGSSFASKHADEPSKTAEGKHHPSGTEKDTGTQEINNNKKHIEERHLDTVEKLKKRSERFKLPMPSEKETTVMQKAENESLSFTQSENLVDSEIKAERPARKRRWTNN